ncbi:MAG TPA: hypothetical protein VG994_00830 [Steroidobacteraceae bacterium]|nr:hypothetical protein [Steroidobacteraceae bacterium]
MLAAARQERVTSRDGRRAPCRFNSTRAIVSNEPGHVSKPRGRSTVRRNKLRARCRQRERLPMATERDRAIIDREIQPIGDLLPAGRFRGIRAITLTTKHGRIVRAVNAERADRRAHLVLARTALPDHACAGSEATLEQRRDTPAE